MFFGGIFAHSFRARYGNDSNLLLFSNENIWCTNQTVIYSYYNCKHHQLIYSVSLSGEIIAFSTVTQYPWSFMWWSFYPTDKVKLGQSSLRLQMTSHQTCVYENWIFLSVQRSPLFKINKKWTGFLEKCFAHFLDNFFFLTKLIETFSWRNSFFFGPSTNSFLDWNTNSYRE